MKQSIFATIHFKEGRLNDFTRWSRKWSFVLWIRSRMIAKKWPKLSHIIWAIWYVNDHQIQWRDKPWKDSIPLTSVSDRSESGNSKEFHIEQYKQATEQPVVVSSRANRLQSSVVHEQKHFLGKKIHTLEYKGLYLPYSNIFDWRKRFNETWLIRKYLKFIWSDLDSFSFLSCLLEFILCI